MSDDFAIGVDASAAFGYLDDGLAKTKSRLLSVAEALASTIEDRARSKADGDVLQVRSGDYLRSIRGGAGSDDNGVFGIVASDAPGAGFLEYGGAIPAHDIMPTAGRLLAFSGGAGEVYASVVHVPEVDVPAHPVIHAAFDEVSDEIPSKFADALKGSWQ